MKIVIVGHGPGLKGRQKGTVIDGFKTVIRFGDSGYWQNDEDYGHKTDYIITGDQRCADVITIGRVPKETWVYGRPGFRDEPFIMRRLEGYNPVICKATDAWLKRFKELGATGYCSARCQEPHFSTGMAAIIMAADRLKAAVLHLPGFEALLAGSSKDYWAGTNKVTLPMAEHDFATEKKLLREVMEYYKFRVESWV